MLSDKDANLQPPMGHDNSENIGNQNKKEKQNKGKKVWILSLGILAIIIVALLMLLKSDKIKNGTAFDQEGKLFKTIKIGSQEWMAENLNVNHYLNGELIPEVKDSKEWATLKTGAWCYFDNDPENGKKSGKLYNWYAVNDPRGLAPKGWHIPTKEEFDTLIRAVGIDGNALKKEDQRKGTNTSGFSALLVGHRNNTGEFYTYSFFWSTTPERDYNWTYSMCLNHDNTFLEQHPIPEGCGTSVRCIKNDPNDDPELIFIGQDKLNKNDFKGAIEVYTKVIRFHPNDDVAYFSRGLAKNKLKDYQGAIQDFSKAIDIKPMDALNYSYRGDVKFESQDYRGAVQDYNRCLEINPYDYSIFISRGNAKGNLSDFESAIKDFNKAIEMKPNLCGGDVYLSRGQAKYSLGNKNGACLDWRKAVELGENQALEWIKKYCN